MKILVLGGSGMAGHVISMYLRDMGYDVTIVSRTKLKFEKLIILNLNNLNKLSDVIINNDYTVIVNAVGLLNKIAEAKKSEAIFLNSFLPHYLEEITNQSKIKIIHLSTDCVFSGKQGNYIESATTDGETFYDRTKILGEIINSKDLTFRNSIIGPDLKKNGIGLFNWFMTNERKSSIKGYSKVYWNGVTTLTLAKAIDSAIKQDLCGLYHLVNKDIISKYNLLRLFNKTFKGDTIKIIKENNIKSNKSLVNTRTDFEFNVGSYEEMILEMKNWITEHKDLYPHYNLGDLK